MKQYNLKQKVMNFLNDEEGASGIEYAIVAAMVAVVIVGFSDTISGAIKGIFESIEAGLEATP